MDIYLIILLLKDINLPVILGWRFPRDLWHDKITREGDVLEDWREGELGVLKGKFNISSREFSFEKRSSISISCSVGGSVIISLTCAALVKVYISGTISGTTTRSQEYVADWVGVPFLKSNPHFLAAFSWWVLISSSKSLFWNLEVRNNFEKLKITYFLVSVDEELPNKSRLTELTCLRWKVKFLWICWAAGLDLSLQNSEKTIGFKTRALILNCFFFINLYIKISQIKCLKFKKLPNPIRWPKQSCNLVVYVVKNEVMFTFASKA